MHAEIPSLARCCFCAPLRYSIIVWAYLKLVFNIFVFGFGLIWFSKYGIFYTSSEYAIYFLIVLISVMLLFFSDIIFSFVLIVGIHKKHTTLLHLYLRFGIAHVVIFVMVDLTIIALKLSRSRHLERTLHFTVIFLTICSSFIILQMYLLLLARSEMLKLKTKGQFQFTNHTSDPKCMMQAEFSSADQEKEILT